ncbi:hypothetical protein [Desulfobulbus elongatus]|uniref:hypothetical protein n=1 Tax=Desulfobulbus elongatus TaxID=53332 RepID=UPI000487C3FA|nr:hypothetical protein [Desulfobulbus elongatus]
MNEVTAAIEAFVDTWAESPDGNKQGFLRLHGVLAGMGDAVVLSFHPRPGVTSSLRAAVPGHGRSLFVMVDVIEDQPRWLSVCFFADMITDPEERGAFVPGGLQGEDAVCFDLDACTEEALAYVMLRLEEACRAAGGR